MLEDTQPDPFTPAVAGSSEPVATGTSVPVVPVPKPRRSGVLDANAILSMGDHADVEYREVQVKNWPSVGETSTVRLGQCSAAALAEWADANESERKTAGVRILVASMVDEAGNPLASTPEIGEQLVTVLLKRVGAQINALVVAALELNGLTEKADTAAKNASGEALRGASPSD